MSNSPMRITMLGTMGVGKTTLLTAMFQEMGYEGKDGFYLKTDMETNKYLSSKWNQMIENFEWPQPTPEYREFNFDLVYGSKLIKKFTFVDYRGGSVRGVETDDEQYAKLCEDIDKSDCLLILADSYFIANTHKQVATARNELQMIQAHLDRYITSHPEKYLSIGVVLTKIDLVQPHQYEDFSNRCFAVFKSLSRITTNNQPRIEFSYIPISVTGYGKCSIQVQKQGNMPTVICKLTDYPEPLQISWPILYSVKKSLEFRKRQVEDLKIRLNGEYDNLANKDWIDSIVAFLRDEKTPGQRRQEILQELHSSNREIQEIEERIAPLLKEVSHLGNGWEECITLPC